MNRQRVARKVSLVFMVIGTVAWSATHSRCAVAVDRPNILFIMTDQQFADAMSCRMGDQYIKTPALDSLARAGTVFTRAYSPNPLCMPARNSIFTGRYPHETGVTKNARPKGGRLASEFVCMGTYFRNAGYATAYCGKWHLCLDQQDPGAHGFKILDSRTKLRLPEDDNFDARVSHAAVKFLEQEHDRPFLLVVSLLNPHNICEWARRGAGRRQRLSCGEIGTPPETDRLPPAPANLEVPKNEPDGMVFIRRAYQVDNGKFPVGRFGPEDWRKQRWGYYRMVEKVDGEIAKVLNAVRAAGIEDTTLVVFTSDHGDCVGDLVCRHWKQWLAVRRLFHLIEQVCRKLSEMLLFIVILIIRIQFQTRFLNLLKMRKYTIKCWQKAYGKRKNIHGRGMLTPLIRFMKKWRGKLPGKQKRER